MCGSSSERLFPHHVQSRPLRWLIVVVLAAVCVGWMLIDTTSPTKYRHSTKYQPTAVKSLHLDDAYRLRMHRVAAVMQQYCDRGSHIVFAHNVELEGTVLNDYMFHECGGKTWLNARIATRSKTNIRCQEEYANVFKTRVQPKTVEMRAVDVSTWTEVQVEGSNDQSCGWLHAIDILENSWL